MNDCLNAEMRDLLPDLVHNRLDSATHAAVEAHLSTCADCREEVALLRDLRATFGRSPAVDVAKITASIPAYRAPARRSWVGWRTAAAIALLVAGGSSIVLLKRDVRTPETIVARTQTPRVEALPTPREVAAAPAEPAPAPADSASSAPSVSAPSPSRVTAPASAGRELAMGGSLVDLSDRELDALLRDIESLDAMPTTEVDAPVISPVAPTAPARATP